MKKNISRQLALIIVAQLFILELCAQSIDIKYTDGSNSSYNLEDVRKITFDLDNMNLHLLDGSAYSWNISTIGYYEYNEIPLNIEELIDKANTFDVVVFPNPTSINLQVQFNLPNNDVIRIELYDLQGKFILYKNMGKQIKGQQQTILDLSHIPSGTYMCRIIGEKNSISKRIVKQK